MAQNPCVRSARVARESRMDEEMLPERDPAEARAGRVLAAASAAQVRAYAGRAWTSVTASLLTGVLAVWVVDSAGGHVHLWLAALAAVLGARMVLVRQWHRELVSGEASPTLWLGRLRAVTLAHGAVWGLFAWAGPTPSSPDAVGALVMLQGGIAVAGMSLLMYDRHAALAFAFSVALPLAMRLALVPGKPPTIVPIAGIMLLLLIGSLYLAARGAARERELLAAARLAESDRALETRRSDALLRRVFEHVGEGICMFGPDLRLQATNARMIELLGVNPELARPGTPVRDWALQLARVGAYGVVDPEVEADRRVVDVSRQVRSIAQRTRPDGRTIETRRTPLPEGGFAMVCVDVTERLASADALFENRRTLDVLLQTTDEGFWFIDNQLRTTDANRAMCRMLGITREALLGRTIYEFVDPENEAVFRRQVELRAEGQAGSYEIALTRSDGTRVYCYNNATPIHDANGNKIGAIGLFSDITAQKQAAAETQRATTLLTEKSDVLETTLESLVQGVISFGGDQRVNAWNRRALDLLDLPEAMMLTRPSLREIGRLQIERGEFSPADYLRMTGEREFSHLPSDRPSDLPAELPAELPEIPGPLRYQRTRTDGTVIEIAAYPAPGGGQVRTYTDVTAAAAAEQALIAAKDEAERANRAKSEFLSRMSHELRTPLNAILGFGQLLQRDTVEPLEPGQQARVSQIVHGGQHLLVLINEVLDLARIEAGTLPVELQAVDVDAVVEDCLRLVQPMARQRPVHLVRQSSGGVAGLASADPTRLRQVLLNLLSNAIKYNRSGGTVTVLTRAIADGVGIEVSDEGEGLDDSQRQRLFQAFERLDADRSAIEGAGIGLALSKSLVELMNGRIGVHSRPGQGSTFWVELRRGPARAGAAAQVEHAAEPRPATAGLRRVLYIEDNAVNQLLMQGMLAHRPDIALQLADLPEQGLAMARESPPDLVLLDIQLPGMSGFEVLRQLRADALTRSTPVIAVSANAMPQDLAQARLAGFNDYLTKPIDLVRLVAAVDKALTAAEPAH